MESHFQNSIIQMPIGFASLNTYRSMEFLTQHLDRQYEIKPEIPLFHIEDKSTMTDKNILSNLPAPPASAAKPAKKTSNEYKTHSCYVCGKVLSSTSSYYVHMKQHSGHKPYHCPMCDVSFCRKPYLEVHMRTHTGERPFQCAVCLKRFTQKSSLNIHKRAHTGERPYSCDICDKKFAVKSYVDAHRWTHIFEKPLSCEKCKIPFNSRSQYVLHMRSHSTSLAYECPCGRTFTKDSYLIRHQIKVHGNGDNHSIPDLSFHQVYVSEDSLDKKEEYEVHSPASVSTPLTEIKEEKPRIIRKLANPSSLVASMPSISPVIRESIEAYVHSSSNQLAKL